MFFRKIAYFILDYLHARGLVRPWSQRHVPDCAMQEHLLYLLSTTETPRVVPRPEFFPPHRQITDKLRERDLEAAMKFHEQALKSREWAGTSGSVPVVRGRLDVDVEGLKPGDLVRWYRDKHRPAPMGNDTVEFRAVDTGKMRRQG